MVGCVNLKLNMLSSLPLDVATLKSWEAYLSLQKNRSPHTVRAYLQTLRSLQAFALALPAGTSPQNLVRDFIKDAASSVTKATQAQRASALRNFINWLPGYGASERAALIRHIQSPRVGKRLPRILDLADIESIVQYIGEQSFAEQVLFYLLYGSGLRVSEALGACWQDVHLGATSLRVLGKGAKERIIPMVPALVELLRKNQSGQSPQTPLLGATVPAPKARQWVRRWGTELKLEDKTGHWHPHKLRHSIASHLLQMGAKVPQIQKMLGHEELATTEKYTQVNPSDLLKIYKKTMPLP